jgi:hypothetical protein
MATPSNKSKITVDIPTDLKQDFKIQCAVHKLNMTDVVESLIGTWVQNLKNSEKGAS